MHRRRSPGRFLAPLALVAVVVVGFLIVQHNRDAAQGDVSLTTTSTTGNADGSTTTAADESSGNKKKKNKKNKKVYVVKSGDILSTVAEKTGLTVEQLQEYNPDLDPQALQVGQKLKLTAGSGSSSSDKTDTTTTP